MPVPQLSMSYLGNNNTRWILVAFLVVFDIEFSFSSRWTALPDLDDITFYRLPFRLQTINSLLPSYRTFPPQLAVFL